MENKNLKVLDLIDKNKNIYEAILEVSKRAHDLMKGALPSIEIKKNENLIHVAIEEYLRKEQIKKNE
ncbi:MAG: DNA-directed RNA polymerase subunit omega [Candidatus Omnitrophica bacterium]|nr:DNA-directed RNA polymerase subunit omega [Candidatus Omnitrophota bacterium]MCM8809871.1 DNA-directed RNA polymerase subunit omega [Candidatus Omnitrophota bacterium]MCM8811185.1 DNA-directed RNA polymerase subunit omega [Candidatus Omnitrophota bacterium]MCM8833513.1 DNA-directed RNA polymerase subunit omega [Candidatus Omnitrophota bacterium]